MIDCSSLSSSSVSVSCREIEEPGRDILRWCYEPRCQRVLSKQSREVFLELGASDVEMRRVAGLYSHGGVSIGIPAVAVACNYGLHSNA